MGDGRGKRGQCWDHYSDRRLDDHECRAAWLEPNALVKSIGKAGVVDNEGAARQVPYDGTPVRIDMVVPVTRIVMLAIRLGPFLVTAIFAPLRVYVRRIEAGNKEGGKQEARHSHGSAPLPGDMNRFQARPLVIRTSR